MASVKNDYQRKSAIVQRIFEAFGSEDIKGILMKHYAHRPWQDIQQDLSEKTSIPISRRTVFGITKKYNVPIKPQPLNARPMEKGRYQKMLVAIFDMPLGDIADAMLLPGQGHLQGVRAHRHIFVNTNKDPFDAVDDLVYAAYPRLDRMSRSHYKRIDMVKLPSLRAEMRQFKYAILAAIGKRSIELGMSVHLDERFPKSVLIKSYQPGPSEWEEELLNQERKDTMQDFDIAMVAEGLKGQTIDECLTLSDGYIILLDNGQSLKLVPARRGDGVLQISFEILSKKKLKGLLSLEGRSATSRIEQIKEVRDKIS